MVALCDHLRADDYVYIAFFHIVYGALCRSPGRGGIPVEPSHAGLGKKPSDLLFHALRAGARRYEVGARAGRAFIGRWHRKVAVMADQAPFPLVQGERHRAVEAGERMSAVPADEAA